MRRYPPLPVLLVMLAAGLVVAGCGGSAPKDSNAVTVYLTKDVSADQRASVEQQVRGLPTMRDVAFRSRQQAYEDFKQKFKDAPDIIAATKPDSLPESFSGTIDSRYAEAAETLLAAAAGVDDVGIALPSGTKPRSGVGMVVQLRPDATGEERTAVESALHALPDAKPARFETADAAHSRLRDRCRGVPTLAAALDRVTAFASYRLTFTMSASYGGPDYLALTRLAGIKAQVFVPPSLL